MYNKIFTKILDSSIWLEPSGTRLIWLTFIAAMDEDGFASFASVANLAHRARVPIEETQAAVECLENADPNSSDPDNDGRRIERVPGGWMILNAPKYRDLVTRTVIKEQTRMRVARHRQSKKDASNAPVTESNAGVTQGNEIVTPSDTATKAEGKARKRAEVSIRKEAAGPHAEFIRRWTEEYPKHHDGNAYVFQAAKDGAAAATLVTKTGKTVDQLIALSIEAWSEDNREQFDCKQAVTIAGLNSRFNQILEVSTASFKAKKGKKPVTPDYLKTEWPEFLESIGQKFVEYQFGPDFLKTDFHQWRKKKAA